MKTARPGRDGGSGQGCGDHLAALRAIPNLFVFRPADAVELAEAWSLALARDDGPSLLAVSEAAGPCLRANHTAENLSARGGYVLVEADGPRQVTLIATGPEVAVAVAARDLLAGHGIAAAVVSLPCFELFALQDETWRALVLGGALRVGIEAGIAQGWERWLGLSGLFLGLETVGRSAPGEEAAARRGADA
ncbi:MAG: transketolase C-terminal domain-containing protein [Acetobacteraceae bacterium]|nr:transketolase C-terminal domain-containing protein [Acetobacteraceae bacterium]